jgi:hypothetical protein
MPTGRNFATPEPSGCNFPENEMRFGQVASGLGDKNSKYGGIGRNGAQKSDAANLALLDVGASYALTAKKLHNLEALMDNPDVRRDFGATWKSRLEETRKRAAAGGPRLSDEEIVKLRSVVDAVDVSSPNNMALLWSGRDIPTEIRLDEQNPSGPIWWDKLSCREAEVFGKLGIAWRLEDTPGGQVLLGAQLNYPEDDPLRSVAQQLWEVLSRRFVNAAHGRIEIIAESAFTDSVFRAVEFEAVLANPKITAVNGLDRGVLPSNASEAYSLLRRWDVERSRRYSEFVNSAADATAHERATALDDFREIQLWYEQDFFEQLGPERELPALSMQMAQAVDQTKDNRAWKYSNRWRAFIRDTEQSGGVAP